LLPSKCGSCPEATSCIAAYSALTTGDGENLWNLGAILEILMIKSICIKAFEAKSRIHTGLKLKSMLILWFFYFTNQSFP